MPCLGCSTSDEVTTSKTLMLTSILQTFQGSDSCITSLKNPENVYTNNNELYLDYSKMGMAKFHGLFPDGVPGSEWGMG